MKRRAVLLGLFLLHLPILAADWCAPHDPTQQHRERGAAPPSATFPLGTDDLGRDVSSRLLHGARLSLAAAAMATLIAVSVGVVVGAAAGYGPTPLDAALTFVTDAFVSVPWIFMLLAVRAALPLDAPPLDTFLLVAAMVGAIGWCGTARLVRAVVYTTAREDYVRAALAQGAGSMRTMVFHVLPAAWPVVSNQLALLLPQFVVAEVSLSFLGLGIAEPWVSLGTLLGEARSLRVLAEEPWRLAPVAGLMVLLVVYNSLLSGAWPGRSARPAAHRARCLVVAAIALMPLASACRSDEPAAPVSGGELRIALRAEPRSFNPVVSLDAVSVGLNALMHASLFRIDARTQEAVPDLAERFDGPDSDGVVTVTLRRGVTFPDGDPFDATDVSFSLAVFQDQQLGSSQVQALRVAERETVVTVEADDVVRIAFGSVVPEPARLLANIPMLPRHRLEDAYREGRLAAMWPIGVSPENVLGLGPFRLAEYSPGRHVILERNPRYWKRDARGRALPYLDRIQAVVVADADAQVARLATGAIDMLSAVDTKSFSVLASTGATPLALRDLGPSLEYSFLLLNLDDAPATSDRAVRARWFHDVEFRRALSLAIDRAAIASLVYDGKATPLGSQVSPGNALWHAGVPPPEQSSKAARDRLAQAGFRWNESGHLLDGAGNRVSISVLSSTSNTQRHRIASLLQADMAAIGVELRVAALEFRALVERVTRTRDFDAAIMALGGGDGDPNAELNVWRLNGSTHLWRLGNQSPLGEWESELDDLMQQQAVSRDRQQRFAHYARVQAIVAEQLPIIPLVSPNHLVAARRGLVGLSPGVTSRDSLWNVEEWSWVGAGGP